MVNNKSSNQIFIKSFFIIVLTLGIIFFLKPQLIEAKPGYPYTTEGIDPWDFYKLYCTSYAAWALNDDGLDFSNHMTGPNELSGTFGNANNWDDNAVYIGYTDSSTPHLGDIAVWEAYSGGAGPQGHVAYVEEVNAGSTVDISEYNWGSAIKSYNERDNVSADSYINFGQSLGETTEEYYRPMSGDYNGDGNTDLAALRDVNSTTQKWYVALSDGSEFDSSTVWAPDFGNRGDHWYIGDFNGDGYDDLSLVRDVDTTTQKWYVALSDGVDGFNSSTVWAPDFGNRGDHWYVGDFDGDGDDDLSLVRDNTSTQQTWYVALSDGEDGFDSSTIWANDFGNRGDKWYVGNFNGDSYDDLALVRSVDSATQKWYVALCDGTEFESSTVWAPDFGRVDDKWFVGDFDNDGDDDLSLVRDNTSTQQTWYVALSDGEDGFDSSTIWANDFGNRGDQWYVGNFDGSGAHDLTLVRDVSSTTQTWYVALCDGTEFESSTVWAPDFGNRGDTYF